MDDETPPPGGKLRAGTLAGTLQKPRYVAGFAHDAGFRDDRVHLVVAIAGSESSLYDGAYNQNPDGTIDRGLMQINSSHLLAGGLLSGWSDSDLFDPAKNLEAAHIIYRAAGYSLNPWVGYTSGAYKAWLSTALGGVANMWRERYGILGT